MSSDEPADEPLEIPWQDLSPGALRAVIEEFVSREGTDYGLEEHDLEAKVAAVRRQLEAGEAALTWDPQTASTHLIATRRRG